MKVLLDATWLISGPPSGKNVVRSIVSHWAKVFPEDELSLLLLKGEEEPVSAWVLEKGIEAEMICSRFRNPLLSILTCTGTWDAVLSQNFPLVATRAKTRAVLIHDLIFKDHPEWFTRRERAYLSLISLLRRRATDVISTSLSETARIERLMPGTNVHPIGLGVPEELSDARPRRPIGVAEDRAFVLLVGRLNERKNLSRVLAAVDDDEVIGDRLVYVVGEKDGKQDRLRLSSRVVMLGSVDWGELAWLYENASLFVFGSLDEGFGLPVIEAAHFGTPVALSRIDPFLELSAEAQFFDPQSTASIAEAAAAALATPRSSRGERVGTETWVEVVQNIRSVFSGELS
jgi:glycosyltransferase involved in cell wall biosynthesis